MGVIRAGDYTFYECNVAFHFRRDNVYSPWETIGVYFTSPKFQAARYLKEHKDIEDAFQAELDSVDSPYIRGGREFLEIWAQRHRGTLSVISPIINYCTSYRGEFRDILIHLFTKYAGNNSSSAFMMLALMIKMKERYFPSLLKDGKERHAIAGALKEAQLI